MLDRSSIKRDPIESRKSDIVPGTAEEDKSTLTESLTSAPPQVDAGSSGMLRCSLLEPINTRLCQWRDKMRSEVKEVKTFEQFCKRYSLPPDVALCITTNHTISEFNKEVCSKNICTHLLYRKKLKNKVYDQKGEMIERITFAERLRTFIDEKKIKGIRVARKYVCASNSGSAFCLYAENMSGDPANIPKELIPRSERHRYTYPDKKISLEQKEGLKRIIKETLFCDFNPSNIRIVGSDIGFIDTERSSFRHFSGSLLFDHKLDPPGYNLMDVMKDVMTIHGVSISAQNLMIDCLLKDPQQKPWLEIE